MRHTNRHQQTILPSTQFSWHAPPHPQLAVCQFNHEGSCKTAPTPQRLTACRAGRLIRRTIPPPGAAEHDAPPTPRRLLQHHTAPKTNRGIVAHSGVYLPPDFVVSCCRVCYNASIIVRTEKQTRKGAKRMKETRHQPSGPVGRTASSHGSSRCWRTRSRNSTRKSTASSSQSAKHAPAGSHGRHRWCGNGCRRATGWRCARRSWARPSGTSTSTA